MEGETKAGRIESRRVYTGKVISLDVDTVRFPDGSVGELEMIRHPLNPLGMKTELIAASPFDTYSWAGSYCWFLLA